MGGMGTRLLKEMCRMKSGDEIFHRDFFVNFRKLKSLSIDNIRYIYRELIVLWKDGMVGFTILLGLQEK